MGQALPYVNYSHLDLKFLNNVNGKVSLMLVLILNLLLDCSLRVQIISDSSLFIFKIHSWMDVDFVVGIK